MRMTSKAWYLVAAGFIVTGIAIGATGISRFVSTVEGMQRVAMPGKAEIVLPAGTSTLYGESRSIVDGKAFQAVEELSFFCNVASPAGQSVSIETTSSRVTYEIGDYEGQNAFDIRVDEAGTYILTCESEGAFVVAIGGGVGTWIVVGLVGGLVPIGLGVLAFILVLVLRSSQKRRAAALARP